MIKLNPAGTGLVYSTYLGGSNNDGATGIAVDFSGNAYVTGWTRSTNFPTMNPIQAQKASGVDSGDFPNSDVFVTTLNGTGTALLFSTYFGGSGGTFSKGGKVFTGSNGDEYGYAIALDSAGDAYVAGVTTTDGEPTSTSFPTTAGAYDKTPGDGFVFMIDPPADGVSHPTTTAVLFTRELSPAASTHQALPSGISQGVVSHDPGMDLRTAAPERPSGFLGSGPAAAALQVLDELFADPVSAPLPGGLE